MNDIYYQKYLKYKSKYLELQKLSGGDKLSEEVKEIIKEMDTYDKDNNNKIKTSINLFLKPLTPDKKKDIPEYKTFGTTNEYQIFRYKIYLLVKNKIDININNFDKLKDLEIGEIQKIKNLKPEQIKKLLNLEIGEIQKIRYLEPEQIKIILQLKPEQIKIILELEPEYIKKLLNLDKFYLYKLLSTYTATEHIKYKSSTTKFRNDITVLYLSSIQIKKIIDLEQEEFKKIIDLTSHQIKIILELEPEEFKKIIDLKPEEFKKIKNLKPEQIKIILELEPEYIKKLLNLDKFYLLLSTYTARERFEPKLNEPTSQGNIEDLYFSRDIEVLYLSSIQIKKIIDLEPEEFKKIIDLKPEEIQKKYKI